MNPVLLVINADDLGFSADINEGIEDLHRAGLVTNASLMVDGKYVDDALTIIERNPQLGIGLHLDLCPVVGLYSRPYDKMREGLRSPGMLSKIADEVDRQIVQFTQLGLRFTHLDGHRHFHALPELFYLVVDVAVRRGLKSIRLAKDWILPRTPSVYWKDEFFHDALAFLRSHEVRYPDKFIYGWKDYSPADFEPGLNELMVHVGYEDKDYLREYQRLSAPEFRRSLEEANVELTSYSRVARL